MIEHRKGIFFTVGLMIAVPAITLVATVHQMMGAGGDEAIRAFLTTRRNWIRATYDWSRAASRYA